MTCADDNPKNLFELYSIQHDLRKFLDNRPLTDADGILWTKDSL
ncbi:MAG TPA: hypothetical protein VEX17_03870 [Bacillales bacterium]|nr:hypothetical protein [Bacillales bacterium]